MRTGTRKLTSVSLIRKKNKFPLKEIRQSKSYVKKQKNDHLLRTKTCSKITGSKKYKITVDLVFSNSNIEFY